MGSGSGSGMVTWSGRTFGRAEDRLLAEELVRWLAVEDVGEERLFLVLRGQLLRCVVRPLEIALLARVRGSVRGRG